MYGTCTFLFPTCSDQVQTNLPQVYCISLDRDGAHRPGPPISYMIMTIVKCSLLLLLLNIIITNTSLSLYIYIYTTFDSILYYTKH